MQLLDSSEPSKRLRPTSSGNSEHYARRPGIYQLIADVTFQPQQPVCDKVEEDSADDHYADHHQPK